MPPPNNSSKGSGSSPKLYDKEYYDTYKSASGVPYDRIEPWLSFFDGIADKIVQDIKPKSVLDVGCAKGFLVEALRDRGVSAFGLDISQYAISQVREDIKPYCWVGSALDSLPQRFDLIVCIEVLEHLSKTDAESAVRNLCQYSDDILFSSTPHDHGDESHLNVQPAHYWLTLFAQHGFYVDSDYDAAAVSQHALRVRHTARSIHAVVGRLAAELRAADEGQRLLEAELRAADEGKRLLEAELRAAGEEKLQFEREMEKYEKRIANLLVLAEKKDHHLGEVETALDEIQGSLGWQLLTVYGTVRNSCLPLGSWRLRLYQSITRRLKFGVSHAYGMLFREDARSLLEPYPLPISTQPDKTYTAFPPSASQDSRQSRVLIVSGAAGDMERYRCHHSQEQFQSLGIHCDIRSSSDAEVPKAVAEYDLIICHRVAYCDSLEKIIRRARFNGIAILFDVDDLVFDPEFLDSIDSLNYMDRKQKRTFVDGVRRYRRTLEGCDGALVTTDYLAQAVRRLGKPAWVHRNALSLELIRISNEACRRRNRTGKGVTIGYASGTRTHNRDFKEVEPALKRILRKHPHITLWIIGYLDLDGDWDEFEGRLKRIPFVQWQDLPELLAQVDINIAPLEPGNPFCEGKSELKYFEAAAVGVPTVASKTSTFEFAIRHGETGFLANDSEGWFASLEELILSSTFRLEMGARARADVLRRYHPSVRGAELLLTLERMVAELRDDYEPSDTAIEQGRNETNQGPIFKEHLLAHALLDGLSGLEIGAAAHNPFNLCTRNVALDESYEFYAEYGRQQMGTEPVPVDIWASADDIPAPDRSQDFILSSHVVEHLPNVIAAFSEWNRIVKDGGYVFMIVPLKGALPVDKTRELTPLAHLVKDYELGRNLETHSTLNVPGGRTGHYHTFSPDSLLQVVYWMHTQQLCHWELEALEDIDSKVGNGFTLVFRVRHRQTQSVANQPVHRADGQKSHDPAESDKKGKLFSSR